MFLSSVAVEFLFLTFCVACFVSCSKIVNCVFCSVFISLSITLAVVHRRVFCSVNELFVEGGVGFFFVSVTNGQTDGRTDLHFF